MGYQAIPASVFTDFVVGGRGTWEPLHGWESLESRTPAGVDLLAFEHGPVSRNGGSVRRPLNPIVVGIPTAVDIERLIYSVDEQVFRQRSRLQRLFDDSYGKGWVRVAFVPKERLEPDIFLHGRLGGFGPAAEFCTASGKPVINYDATDGGVVGAIHLLLRDVERVSREREWRFPERKTPPKKVIVGSPSSHPPPPTPPARPAVAKPAGEPTPPTSADVRQRIVSAYQALRVEADRLLDLGAELDHQRGLRDLWWEPCLDLGVEPVPDPSSLAVGEEVDLAHFEGLAEYDDEYIEVLDLHDDVAFLKVEVERLHAHKQAVQDRTTDAQGRLDVLRDEVLAWRDLYLDAVKQNGNRRKS